MRYKRVFGVRKSFRYMNDRIGRWLWMKAEEVPPSVKAYLDSVEVGTIYEDTGLPDEPVRLASTNTCIFCQARSTYKKYIHGQMVDLCEDDYQNKTTGEVGAKVKEMLYAKGED